MLRFFARRFIGSRLPFVTEEDILQIVGRNGVIGHYKLSAEEILDLKDEAKMIRESKVWDLIQKEIEYRATLKMGRHASTPDDIVYGNALFYHNDLVNGFLKKLKEL